MQLSTTVFEVTGLTSNLSFLFPLLKVYTAYDDAEFADGNPAGTRPSILSQYDADKKSAPKFSLGKFTTQQYFIVILK